MIWLLRRPYPPAQKFVGYQRVRSLTARWRHIVDHLPFPPASAVDLGAATGELSIQLAETFGTKVLAIDARGAGQTHPLVEWRVGRIGSAELRTLPRVEVAFALSALHQLPDWAAAWWALNEIADWIVVELPHPEEEPALAGTGQLPWLHELVAGSDAKLIGCHPGWKTSLPRPTYLVRSTPPTGIPAAVKAGAGKTARQLPKVPGLAAALGYQPYPGSLGMDLESPFDDRDRKLITLPSSYGDYQFVPARLSGIRCHVMRPPRAKNRPGTAEVTAPVRLREVLALPDGAPAWLD